MARELRVSRITTLALGVIAVALGIAFEKQNIAFMVSLAFAIAASANFPVLFMSVLWKDCTTKGAVIGGFLGLISSVALTVVSPAVWRRGTDARSPRGTSQDKGTSFARCPFFVCAVFWMCAAQRRDVRSVSVVRSGQIRVSLA